MGNYNPLLGCLLTRLCLSALTTTLLFACFSVRATAQRNPPMASAERDAQKEALYARYSEHKKWPGAEHQRLAYEAGKEYVERFGADNDPEVSAVRKFVTEYERVRRQYDLYTAYSAKNYAKTFELGRPLVQKDPENFFFLGVLAEAGYENALAGNPGLNADTIDYTRRAIQLMEAGKVTKPDPFKSMDVAGAFLNVVLGWFLKDQSPVEAAAAFRKALLLDSPYRTDPLIYHRLGIAILKGEFAQLSAEYNDKYGSKPSSPEQRAMFERLNHLGERALDAYARAAALSTKPEQQLFKTKLVEQLTALYKSLHNNSDAGLNELIASVLSTPLP